MATNKHIIDVQTKGAGKSEKQIKGVSGALGGMAKQAGIAAAAYFGTRMLLDGVKKSIDLFAKQELAEKKLRFAAGASTSELIKQAQALQKNTRFGDEAIIAQQAYVKSLGISTEQTKEIIAASVDLASAMNISLESAVMNTTKTLSGMHGELGEKLPAAFKLLTAEQLKAGEGIVFIREQFKGTAQEEVKTLSGSLDQMGNAIGDAAEAFGSLLGPAIIASANTVTFLAESFQRLFLWQDKYKALSQETLGLLSDQDLLLMANKNSAQQVQGTLAILNEIQKNYVDSQKLFVETSDKGVKSFKEQNEWITTLGDGYTELTHAQIVNMINNGDMMELIFALTEAGSGYAVTLQTLMDKYNELPESQKMAFEVQDAFNQQQLDNITNAEKQIALQEQFATTYPDQAKQLGFLTKEEKKANEERDKKFKAGKKWMGVLSQVSKAGKADALLQKRISQGKAVMFTAEAVAQAMPNWGAVASAIALGASQVATIEAQKFAKGANFITDGVTPMIAGEAGRELVQITPLEGPNLEGPQGSNITLNISGNVMSEEYTEDVIIPQIKEGLRLGGDIGIN